MLERIYLPSVEQSNAIAAAGDKAVTRDDMAEFYADCLRHHEGIDWRALNEAIMARWPRGLSYIRTRAWKMFEAKP